MTFRNLVWVKLGSDVSGAESVLIACNVNELEP